MMVKIVGEDVEIPEVPLFHREVTARNRRVAALKRSQTKRKPKQKSGLSGKSG
jgi:hypothetical protein